MTRIIELNTIKSLIKDIDLSPLIEEGFVSYSNGQVIVPPVGELSFTEPPGDTHIKYGCIKGGDNFVIKIASGFYNNPDLGLPSNSGLMLVFSSKTGMLDTILMDEGYLTDVRTALAGQIAARYLAPTNVEAIGVLGTGIHARMQVQYLSSITPCKEIVAWGRTPEKTTIYQEDMESQGYTVHITEHPAEVAARANLIVTTTAAQSPLLYSDDIRPGTHITAMGSDTREKQELDSAILTKADLVVGDSISQCRERGEISKGLEAGSIRIDDIVELGDIISAHNKKGKPQTKARRSADEITMADLTGVAVQDIQIAKAVCQAADNCRGEAL